MSEKTIKILILAIVSFVFTAIGLVLSALTFGQLWFWYVVPVFNLPALTFAQSAGIVLVIGFATHQVNLSSLDEDRQFAKIAADSLVHPTLVLIIGFIVLKLSGR